MERVRACRDAIKELRQSERELYDKMFTMHHVKMEIPLTTDVKVHISMEPISISYHVSYIRPLN